jgi:hypothetical protein
MSLQGLNRNSGDKSQTLEVLLFAKQPTRSAGAPFNPRALKLWTARYAYTLEPAAVLGSISC